MSHFKHLVLEDRITIQSDLHDGLSFGSSTVVKS